MYSYRVEQAIRAASVLHKDQNSSRLHAVPVHDAPYCNGLHPYRLYDRRRRHCSGTLARHPSKDTDYTLEELREDFGGRVGDIVEVLTEPKSTPENRITWKDRKLTYARQLKKGSQEALLIAAADKIHNFRTTVEDYGDAHDRFYQDFGKNFDERLEVYQQIANVINAKLHNPILAEFNHVFEAYREFLLDVKRVHENRY
jgi:(p)ppGpp synthase/HD superfamily hydrolase